MQRRDAYILMIVAHIECLTTDKKIKQLLGCIRDAIKDYPADT